MVVFLTVALLALATFRVTRVITTDRVFEVTRWHVQDRAEKRWEARTGLTSDGDTWHSPLAYLLSCDWCVSIWVGLALTFTSAIFVYVPVPVLTWLAVSAVTGLLSRWGSA